MLLPLRENGLLNKGCSSPCGIPKLTLSLCLPQTKPGVISSVSGLNLGKGPLQIQVVGKGLSQLVPAVQSQQLVSSRGNEFHPKPLRMSGSVSPRL